MVVTSPENFTRNRDILDFKVQGLPHRLRRQVQKMNDGDKVVIYIMKAQKFGAITKIVGDYYEEHTKLWTEDDEMWPSRRNQVKEIVLDDDELVDVKRLVRDLKFVTNKNFWGAHFQGSIRTIPEEDFKLIEAEMKKVVSMRTTKSIDAVSKDSLLKTEDQYKKEIMSLPLNANSLHDRIGLMLEQIGSWMGYHAYTRHKIITGHAYEIDVAWLKGRNPEAAIEVHISGNLTEAKDRLAQARKFNYRKVVIVLESSYMQRLNDIMKHEPELRSWMEAWSIGAIYEMYKAGETFFEYFHKLHEAVYKDKVELKLIK